MQLLTWCSTHINISLVTYNIILLVTIFSRCHGQIVETSSTSSSVVITRINTDHLTTFPTKAPTSLVPRPLSNITRIPTTMVPTKISTPLWHTPLFTTGTTTTTVASTTTIETTTAATTTITEATTPVVTTTVATTTTTLSTSPTPIVATPKPSTGTTFLPFTPVMTTRAVTSFNPIPPTTTTTSQPPTTSQVTTTVRPTTTQPTTSTSSSTTLTTTARPTTTQPTTSTSSSTTLTETVLPTTTIVPATAITNIDATFVSGQTPSPNTSTTTSVTPTSTNAPSGPTVSRSTTTEAVPSTSRTATPGVMSVSSTPSFPNDTESDNITSTPTTQSVPSDNIWNVQIVVVTTYNQTILEDTIKAFGDVGYRSFLSSTFNISEDRLTNFTVTALPQKEDSVDSQAVVEFRIIPGDGVKAYEVADLIMISVANETLVYEDGLGNISVVNKSCTWTDYGSCPDQPCRNGGICRVRPIGDFYCECPQPQKNVVYEGRYCEIDSTPTTQSVPSDNSWNVQMVVVTTYNQTILEDTITAFGDVGYKSFLSSTFNISEDRLTNFMVTPLRQKEDSVDSQAVVDYIEDSVDSQAVVEFRIVPGDGVKAYEVADLIMISVGNETLVYEDGLGNISVVNKSYIWTDYGPCPNQPCRNEGICRVRPIGDFYCECPEKNVVYVGKYCETDTFDVGNSAQNNEDKWKIPVIVVCSVVGGISIIVIIALIVIRLKKKNKKPVEDHRRLVDGTNTMTGTTKGSEQADSIVFTVLEEGQALELNNNPGFEGGSLPRSGLYQSVGPQRGVAYNGNTFSDPPVGRASSRLSHQY